MSRLWSRMRDLRIASRIVLPLAAAMLVLVIATSLLAGEWVSRSIEHEVDERLSDSRRDATLAIEAWEDDTATAVEHLAAHAHAIAGTEGREELAGLVGSEPHRRRLDYAVAVLPDGDVLAAGDVTPPVDSAADSKNMPAPPSQTAPDPARDGDAERLVQTARGWALESSTRVDVPTLGMVEIRGGRLLSNELMEGLRATVGEETAVSLTVGGQVVAQTDTDVTASACNGCHAARAVVPAAVIDTRAAPSTAGMGDDSRLMLHAPLVVGGTTVGTVTVHTSAETVAAAQSRARWSVFGVGTAIFAVLVGAQWVVSRSIARPITRLAETSREIAAGNLDKPLDCGGGGEVGVLAESVATLTRSLAGQIKELSLLQEASLAANSSLELDEVLESIMESATDVLAADSGSIMLLDRSRSRLEVVAARGRHAGSRSEDTVSLTGGPAAWVVRHRRPLLLPDDLTDPDIDVVLNRPDISSSVIVPIETRDALLGVLNLNMCDAGRRFDQRTLSFARTLASHSALAIDKARHHQEVNDLYSGLIRALASAIDAKDPYTYGHSEMVHRYAALIGAHMALDEHLLKGLETAAYLHDIGKIGVKDAVLSKPSRLTADERRAVEAHPTIGAQILDQIVFPWPVIDAVRHHHERWDGGGYPSRLSGRDIPLHARVLAVADSFDAMTSDRPYRLGRNFDEAVTEVLACAGSQFDPEVVQAFVSIQEEIGAALDASRATRVPAA